MKSKYCLSSKIKEIKEILEPILREKKVLKAILFGSYARGTEGKRSDIDIFIIKNTRKRFFNRADEFKEVYEIFSDRGVDLLIHTPKEIERYGNRDFVKKIFEEGIVIYES
ncbi:MAG: nucleotidyltransferase domain-containing protein [Chitinispirillaceae bacterium]|nr:nucleotidyltransferase domain-containing protein [Chitinispirillaceae bacterium]